MANLPKCSIPVFWCSTLGIRERGTPIWLWPMDNPWLENFLARMGEHGGISLFFCWNNTNQFPTPLRSQRKENLSLKDHSDLLEKWALALFIFMPSLLAPRQTINTRDEQWMSVSKMSLHCCCRQENATSELSLEVRENLWHKFHPNVPTQSCLQNHSVDERHPGIHHMGEMPQSAVLGLRTVLGTSAFQAQPVPHGLGQPLCIAHYCLKLNSPSDCHSVTLCYTSENFLGNIQNR